MPSYRVVQSGHITEIYRYDMTAIYNPDKEVMSSKGGRDREGKEERKMEYRETVNHRAREKLRRLINANFTGDDLFITLTYAEHVTDIEESSYNLKKFLQKMKRRQKDFRYVAVIEFTKIGRIHYHMLCNYNVKWNTHEELQEHERDLAKVWGFGFVDIGYKKNDNPGAYLLKYMTKEHVDERLEGKKRYFFSRNLVQPKVLTGKEARDAINEAEKQIPVFTSSFYNEFTGNVQYLEYNPKRQNANYNHVEYTAKKEFGSLVEVKE